MKRTEEFRAGIHMDNLMKMTLGATCLGCQNQEMMAPLTQVVRGRVQPAKSRSHVVRWSITSMFPSLDVLFTKITLRVSLFYTTLWAGFVLTLTWVQVWESPHKLPCLSKVHYNININVLLNLNVTEKEGKSSKCRILNVTVR